MKTRRKKKKPVRKKDPEKEATYKALVSKLETAGFDVRREKLKQGFGWRVQSGACRAGESHIIFVDQRLSQDDQIGFLKEKLEALGLVEERSADIPEPSVENG